MWNRERAREHSIERLGIAFFFFLFFGLRQKADSCFRNFCKATTSRGMNFKLTAKKTPFQKHKEEQELKRKVKDF